MDMIEIHYSDYQKIKHESKILKKITGHSLADCREFYARVFGYQHFHELQSLAKKYNTKESIEVNPLVVCFDIETNAFNEIFRNATSDKVRLKHVPQMRVACSYDTGSEKYKYYEPHQVQKLIRLITKAHTLITFNGKCFDLLLLKKHHRLNLERVTDNHIDLCEILSIRSGYPVGLNKATKLNFGETKHTKGRDMKKHSLEKLKDACQSDVSQTFRLYELHEKGSLIAPKYRSRNREEEYVLEAGDSRAVDFSENNTVVVEEYSGYNVTTEFDTDLSHGEYLLSKRNPYSYSF